MLAAAVAAAVAAPAGATTAVAAACWSAISVLAATRRAEVIRAGQWAIYARSHLTEAACRTLTAVLIATHLLPGAYTGVFLAAGAFPALACLPRITTPRNPADVAHKKRLLQHIAASGAAAWVLHGTVIIQNLRNAAEISLTLAVATTSRAALWITPALTAIAAHQHHRHLPTRAIVLAAPVAVVALTPLTVAATALLDGSPPPIVPALAATTATAVLAASYVTQQHLIALQRHQRVLRIWAAAAIFTTAAWIVIPPQPLSLFIAQAVGAIVSLAALSKARAALPGRTARPLRYPVGEASDPRRRPSQTRDARGSQ